MEYRCELQKRIAELEAELDRLNKMRVHCGYCGADYMATGIEAGCPCRITAERDRLQADVKRLVEAGKLALLLMRKCKDMWGVAPAIRDMEEALAPFDGKEAGDAD